MRENVRQRKASRNALASNRGITILAHMRILTFIALVILVTSISCSTTPPQQDAEKVPKHAKRVKVAVYDSTNRPKTSFVDIYDTDSQVRRPFKEIAFLTCEGRPD